MPEETPTDGAPPETPATPADDDTATRLAAAEAKLVEAQMQTASAFLAKYRPDGVNPDLANQLFYAQLRMEGKDPSEDLARSFSEQMWPSQPPPTTTQPTPTPPAGMPPPAVRLAAANPGSTGMGVPPAEPTPYAEAAASFQGTFEEFQALVRDKKVALPDSATGARVAKVFQESGGRLL